MNQRRRRDSRFPYRERICFRSRDSEQLIEACTRDISLGGLFIVHRGRSIWPGAHVELHLPCDDERTISVQARVTHIVRSPTAALGVEPGMGVQFENLSADAAEHIRRLVERAKGTDTRRRVPTRARNAVSRRLDPIHEYVLKFVDGVRAPEALADATGMDVDAVIEELHDLMRLGVVDFVSPTQASAPAGRAGDDGELELDRLSARTSIRAKSLCPAGGAPAHAALVDTTAAAMSRRNHYELLGVAPDATPQQIRTAFLARYSHFDEQAGAVQGLSAYGQALEVIRQRLVDAYTALSSPKARADYDDYCACCELLAKVDAGNKAPSEDEHVALWERRACYEEARGDNVAAANSWCRLYELRPLDLRCIQKTACLILEAKLGVRRAEALAQQAVELAPTDPYNHRLLARVYLESGLRLRARRQLQKAAELERVDTAAAG